MPDPREPLGRLVREVWVACAEEAGDTRPSHLAGWDDLDAWNREVDMRIGVAVATYCSGDRSEWLCGRCETIHPRQDGQCFTACPVCGTAMAPTSPGLREIERLRAIVSTYSSVAHPASSDMPAQKTSLSRPPASPHRKESPVIFAHKHQYEAVAVQHRTQAFLGPADTTVLWRCPNPCSEVRTTSLAGRWTLGQVRGEAPSAEPGTDAQAAS